MAQDVGPRDHPSSQRKLATILKYGIAVAGGAVGTLVIMWLVAATGISSASSPVLPGIAKLAPPDATQLTVWDLDQLRNRDYLKVDTDQQSPESFIENRMLYLQETEAVDAYEVTEYMIFLRQDWQPVEIVSGPMDFQYMEIELEDANYDKGSYRGYETWTGAVAYAFLPEEGYVIASSDEDTVEAFLNHYHRREELTTNDEDLPITQVYNKIGQGASTTAQRGRQNCPIARCQAMAIATNDYDPEYENIRLKFTLLFRNEETAEKAAWDYDDVADYVESRFNVEVIDLESDGRFVTGDAAGDMKFLLAAW